MYNDAMLGETIVAHPGNGAGALLGYAQALFARCGACVAESAYGVVEDRRLYVGVGLYELTRAPLARS